MTGDFRAANRAADRIHSVFLKIKALGVGAREALIQVALEGETAEAAFAATYSLNYDAGRSANALKRLAKVKGFLGFQARETLKRWQNGEGDLDS